VPAVGASDGEPKPSPAPTVTATREPPPPAVEPRRPRRLTWRVVAFLVVLTLVLGVAVAAVGWYARRTYYVGLDGDQVAVYKGRPGGLLWFEPTLYQRKPLTVHDVLPSRVADLRAGQPEASKADADRYVNRLREEAAEVARQSGATTTVAPPPPPP
jgi:protein phosphatase